MGIGLRSQMEPKERNSMITFNSIRDVVKGYTEKRNEHLLEIARLDEQQESEVGKIVEDFFQKFLMAIWT